MSETQEQSYLITASNAQDTLRGIAATLRTIYKNEPEKCITHAEYVALQGPSAEIVYYSLPADQAPMLRACFNQAHSAFKVIATLPDSMQTIISITLKQRSLPRALSMCQRFLASMEVSQNLVDMGAEPDFRICPLISDQFYPEYLEDMALVIEYANEVTDN